MNKGELILVAGPSGSGKDSVLDAARLAMADDPRFIFPRRAVTRPADAGAERHEALTPELFGAIQAQGGFALSWQAHGLFYGIRADIAPHLAAGRNVVVNVSRSVIEDARRNFPPVRVILITAPVEVLARRLTARGREAPEDIRRRLNRAQMTDFGNNAVTIANDGDLHDAVTQFIAALTCHPLGLTAASLTLATNSAARR